VPSEVQKVEVQMWRLTSCLSSGGGGRGNDRDAVCGLDRKTMIEQHVCFLFCDIFGPQLLRIGSKDNQNKAYYITIPSILIIFFLGGALKFGGPVRLHGLHGPKNGPLVRS